MVTTAARISSRTLAEFMTSSASTQRRIVRTNKYPSDEEAKAIVAYYRDARAAVERFFDGGGQAAILEQAICRMSGESVRAAPSRSARLNQNIRAIGDFENGPLSTRRFEVEKRPTVELELAAVCLKVRPSLCLRDQDRNIHWVFLDFSEGELDDRKAGIVLQLFLQSARREAIELKSRFAEYYHVNSGQTQRANRHGSRLQTQIEASCQTFGDIWNSL